MEVLGILLFAAGLFIYWQIQKDKKDLAVVQQLEDDAVAVADDRDIHYNVDIVGESHYQQALEALAGGRQREGVLIAAIATLILDNENRYDPQAVRIEIQGLKVGHLSRDNARAYRARLQEIGQPTLTATCPAQIRGGWDRGKGKTGHFGVKLDLSGI